LLIGFGGKLFLSSIDVAHHYVLVDEIIKHGGVRPGPLPNMGPMAVYPPASHWLAAVVGWIGGSGLVGLMLISIASIYVVYFLIARLVQGEGVLGLAVFAVLFVALSRTQAQIGWEVVGNFFYPQLVGDVAFFASLYWLAANKSTPLWRQALVVALSGAATMWIQPVSAIHILGAGVGLFVFRAFQHWLDTRTIGAASLGAAVFPC
jgi:hypothetical protein